MCGIAGIIMRDAPVRQEDLMAMGESLQHRGPDRTRFLIQDNVGLVHTRLSVIDLQGGWQPMESKEAGLSLVANGEIYNYIELRRELCGRTSFTTESDCEVILHAYHARGSRCVKDLNGMFAFALYDRRNEKIILARDRLGIKPLFIVRLSDRILFASELKALIPHLPGGPQIREEALAQFLTTQFTTGRHTIIRGIQRVLPGEILEIDRQLEIRRERYWSPFDIEPRRCSYEDAKAEFDSIIEQVFREHMRSDVDFGLFLSGGIDSSLVCALLQTSLGRPLKTFTVSFDSRDKDMEHAQQVADYFGTDHTVLPLDQHAIVSRIPHAIWAADELLRDYACLPTSHLAHHSAQSLKVVFTGEGADEVFAGYGRYRKAGITRAWRNWLLPRRRGYPERRWSRWVLEDEVFTMALKRAKARAQAELSDPWASLPRTRGFVRRAQCADLVTELPDGLLAKVDRMLMAFGMEGRVPFLDHRVVEFGISLPDHLKIKTRHGKVFLQRWAASHLPREHLWQKKRGFRVPFGTWLKGPWFDAMAQRLIANPAIGRWFEPKGVRHLIQLHRQGRVLHKEILGLIYFAVWHRIFIENHCQNVPSLDEDLIEWIS